VTALSVASLSGEKVYQELFSLTDESEMGHIRLSREADLVVVAPASADILSKMAHGRADDLATTALLATDKTVLVAPAMNVEMWGQATQANAPTLERRGTMRIGWSGDLACGGERRSHGRAAQIIYRSSGSLRQRAAPGRRAHPGSDLTSSGALHRNRSSGRRVMRSHPRRRRGAPDHAGRQPDRRARPAGVGVRHVETAAEMWRRRAVCPSMSRSLRRSPLAAGEPRIKIKKTSAALNRTSPPRHSRDHRAGRQINQSLVVASPPDRRSDRRAKQARAQGLRLDRRRRRVARARRSAAPITPCISSAPRASIPGRR
jgi:phosphopantothenoylcysteine synthetase/decarboxylase